VVPEAPPELPAGPGPAPPARVTAATRMDRPDIAALAEAATGGDIRRGRPATGRAPQERVPGRRRGA
jgi:hypothetical protein